MDRTRPLPRERSRAPFSSSSYSRDAHIARRDSTTGRDPPPMRRPEAKRCGPRWSLAPSLSLRLLVAARLLADPSAPVARDETTAHPALCHGRRAGGGTHDRAFIIRRSRCRAMLVAGRAARSRSIRARAAHATAPDRCGRFIDSARTACPTSHSCSARSRRDEAGSGDDRRRRRRSRVDWARPERRVNSLGAELTAGALRCAPGRPRQISQSCGELGRALTSARRAADLVPAESPRQRRCRRLSLAERQDADLSIRRRSSVIRLGRLRGRHRAGDSAECRVNAGPPATPWPPLTPCGQSAAARHVWTASSPRQPPSSAFVPPLPDHRDHRRRVSTVRYERPSIRRRSSPRRSPGGGPALPSQRAVPTSASKAVRRSLLGLVAASLLTPAQPAPPTLARRALLSGVGAATPMSRSFWHATGEARLISSRQAGARGSAGRGRTSYGGPPRPVAVVGVGPVGATRSANGRCVRHPIVRRRHGL